MSETLTIRKWGSRGDVTLTKVSDDPDDRRYADGEGRQWLEADDNPHYEEEHNQPELVELLEFRLYDVDFYLLGEDGVPSGDGGSYYEASAGGGTVAEGLSPEEAFDKGLMRVIPPGSTIYRNKPERFSGNTEFKLARWASGSIEYFGPVAFDGVDWKDTRNSANAMEIDWEKTIEALGSAAG